jgi:hypothetical protein
MHKMPVSSKTRNPQDRDQWYKKVCTGMYEKGLYAQVCLEYVLVHTYMYLTQAHWDFSLWRVKSPSEKVHWKVQ